MTVPNTYSHQLIELQDDFNRVMCQTKALASILMPDDESSRPSTEVVASGMWLLSDRLSDIEAVYEKIIKLAKDSSQVDLGGASTGL